MSPLSYVFIPSLDTEPTEVGGKKKKKKKLTFIILGFLEHLITGLRGTRIWEMSRRTPGPLPHSPNQKQLPPNANLSARGHGKRGLSCVHASVVKSGPPRTRTHTHTPTL